MKGSFESLAHQVHTTTVPSRTTARQMSDAMRTV